MNEDKYPNSPFVPYLSPPPVSRRQFLKRLGALGGGIVIYFSFGTLSSRAQGISYDILYQNVPTDFNAFLKIEEDGKISCFTGKIEMGQGIITSLAQVVAEELCVSLDTIDLLMGDTDLCPFDIGTAGSTTTRFFGPLFRAAAAEAKGVLIELAAEHLEIPAEKLDTKDGVIFDKGDRKNSVTYSQLSKGKKIQRRLKRQPDFKAVSKFTVMGKHLPRRDALEKVTGKAKYAGDIRLADMLYAKILRPPARGAQLKSVDTSAAKQMDGVQIVEDNDLIAILHKYPDEAEKALTKVKADFDMPEAKVDDKTIFDHLLNVAPKETVVAQGGALKAGSLFSRDLFEETYLNSYVAHAPMETHTALAKIEGDKATLWVSTQIPFMLREMIAQVLGFPSQNVRIITPFVGGAFGGKIAHSEAVEAARLAKLTGKPVQVAWSREEEFLYDTFRPASVVKIKSGMNGSGRIMLWDYSVYFAGEGGSQQFYEVPHHRTAVLGDWERPTPGAHPFDVGAWRAPANNTNTFARESHIDIMASRAGKDPLQFRLNNLNDKKMQNVLKAAAEKFGWRPSKPSGNRGIGVACGIHAGTYVAAMAEVEVDKNSGAVQVERVICALDMGLVINPEGVKTQVEGCVTMGLGYALSEEIHFKGGEIIDLNFDTYEIPRFSHLPKIDTVLIEADSFPPQSCGEPPIICMGAVIANAIYDATGARLFQLPMTPERIKEAMK